MEDPQEDPLAVHCFCVCSGSVLLGDLLGVSGSRECDLLSVLSIYPKILLCVFIVYRHIVRILCLLLYSAICWCVLVTLVQLSVLAKWLAIERPLWWHLHEVRRLSAQSPGGRDECLCIFLLSGLFMLLCVSPGPTQYIFHTLMAWYSLYMLKVPLNSKQTNKYKRHLKTHLYNVTYSYPTSTSTSVSADMRSPWR